MSSREIAQALCAGLLWLGGCNAASPGVPAPGGQVPQEPTPIVAGLPAEAGEYDLALDVLHYDVELTLGGDEVRGRATVRVDPRGARELPLDFTGLAVLSVTAGGSPVTFRHEGGKLRIPLPEDSGTVSIVVDYSGVPDDGLIIRPNIHGKASAFVDNWPNRTRFWLPSIDHPSEKATASFTVHAPGEWEVVANGHLVGEPTPADAPELGAGPGYRTWEWETRVLQPSYTLVVGATDFAIESLGRAACGRAPASIEPDGCVDVSIWVYPEDLDAARRIFARAPQMVDYFTELVGPFPFEKLAHVQSATRFGGMENSSAIFYSEEAISAGVLSEGTVSHEIAHQWFGDSATESDWSHLWLSEGFATYFGALFFEEADGVDDFRRRMEDSRRSYLQSPAPQSPIIPDSPPANLFDLLNANSYEKGGWVLHMLRGVVGDELFFRGVREYYARYQFGNATTLDFQKVMEETAGVDLGWFFHQWIYEPGHPILDVDWNWDEGTGLTTVTVSQTQPAHWPAFRLPLDVHVVSGGSVDSTRIEVEERAHTTTIPSPVRPEGVEVDPHGWILRGDGR